MKQTNNNNALANLTYSSKEIIILISSIIIIEITYVEADQTQSVFGRMSFGSEQFNQHLPEQKLNTSEDKIVNLELKIPGRFVESESESLKKENSLQNSKLKEQIVR